MPLVPSWSIPLCRIPHSGTSSDFAASLSLFPGTVTAHSSRSGSAIAGFSRCSHTASFPSSRSFVPSSSILLLVTTTQRQSSTTHLPCCRFFSLYLLALPSTPPPCLILTAPIPQSQLTFQIHLLFLSCFSLLTHAHSVPTYQLPTPNSKHHLQNWEVSSFRLPPTYPQFRGAFWDTH